MIEFRLRALKQYWSEENDFMLIILNKCVKR